MSTSTAVLTPPEIDALRSVLPSDAIARLCAAIDGAIGLDPEARHALQALADRLEDGDTRTAHYLILSGGEIVGCTVGENSKADADRGNTFQKIQPGTVCPHGGWLVEAQTHWPL